MSVFKDDDQRDAARAFIRVLDRSADVGDGWRNVSNVLRKVVASAIEQNPDLYETRELAGLQIRLTERGKVARDFI